MPDTNKQQEERRAYLLDISLFIFDILDPQKVLKSALDQNAILEVPSAFVTMIWSSVSGDTLLQDLIYAYLVGLRNNGTLSRNSNEQISRWANANNEELRAFSQVVLDHILNFYSQYIDGATRGTSQLRSYYPIKRYEPVLPDQSNEDLLRMRKSYGTEFNIRSHPLYDLYFLQIYHAQSIGIAASPLLQRIFVFLGRQATGAISRWIGETDPRAINLSTRERYRQTLGWFVNEYIADQFLDMAIDGALNLGVSFIVAGTPGLNVIAGVSVANVVRKAVVDPIVKSPYLKKGTDVPVLLGLITGSFLLCVCVFLLFPRLRPVVFNATTPTPTLTVSNASVLFPDLTPQPTDFAFIVTEFPTPRPTSSSENSPITSLNSSDPGYCLYVVQPGDTIQGIASRFNVSVSDLSMSYRDLPLSVFEVNQMIKVNASCCVDINGMSFIYTVQKGDNLYRIANQNSISIDYLASVNNLYDSRYIQTGQMLCIPKSE